jgi:hypothetical protein
LIDNIGLGNKQLAGAYCVRNGTNVESDALNGPRCNAAQKNCEQ